jgi:hypothetical protein
MANSKLLKEAIADAKAVRETAIANAKLALEEAFTPRLQSILSRKLQAEMEDEEEVFDDEADAGDVDVSDDAVGETDFGSDELDAVDTPTDDVVGDEDEDEELGETFEDPDDDVTGATYDVTEDDDTEFDEDELDLEEIIRELESELDGEEDVSFDDEDTDVDVTEDSHEDEAEFDADDEELDIEIEDDELDGFEEEYDVDATDDDEFSDEIDLDEILREMGYGDGEEEVQTEVEVEDDVVDNTAELEAELGEAYSTIKELRKTINEVNLLNAKLLYTNKLFRSYNLTNEQKHKVVENLDRTSNVREVKLVYATLSESMKMVGTERKSRRYITEGMASKVVKSTAPKQEIITEVDELSNRFKKLAGIING